MDKFCYLVDMCWCECRCCS